VFGRFILNLVCSLVVFIAGLSSAYCGDGVVLRDPKKAECGVYLSSLVDTSTGYKVAELDKTDIQKKIPELRELLEPKVIYVNPNTGKAYEDLDQLKADMDDGVAKPVVDYPIVFIVGAPLVGLKGHKLKKATQEILESLNLEHPVRVKTIGRPVKPTLGGPRLARPILAPIEYAALAAQHALFIAPLPQDYQKPTKKEVDTMVQKLATANSVQQAILFATQPFSVAMLAGVTNYGNSAATGVYRKFISNWFGRQYTGPSFVAAQVLLGSFFVSEFYWYSQLLEWEHFKDIATLEGWKTFIALKWSAIAFGVAWRNFLYKAVIPWERGMAKRDRVREGRNTAAKFELIGTLVATPAYIVAAVAGRDNMPTYLLNVFGHDVMELTPMHGVMLSVAAFFAALDLYTNKSDKPEKLSSRIKQKIVNASPEKLQNFFHMDNWVGAMDTFDKAMVKTGTKTGLIPLKEWISQKMSDWKQARKEKARADDSADETPVNWEEIVDFSEFLEKAMLEDPEFRELVQKDPAMKKLIEQDPTLQKVFQNKAEQNESEASNF
jgi:hypothetical protein